MKIPARAYQVLRYIRDSGRAPKGHQGGRRYFNLNGLLPDETKYREFDVDPLTGSQSRTPHRIVIDETTGQAWYTPDHYNSFAEMKGGEDETGSD